MYKHRNMFIFKLPFDISFYTMTRMHIYICIYRYTHLLALFMRKNIQLKPRDPTQRFFVTFFVCLSLAPNFISKCLVLCICICLAAVFLYYLILKISVFETCIFTDDLGTWRSSAGSCKMKTACTRIRKKISLGASAPALKNSSLPTHVTGRFCTSHKSVHSTHTAPTLVFIPIASAVWCGRFGGWSGSAQNLSSAPLKQHVQIYFSKKMPTTQPSPSRNMSGRFCTSHEKLRPLCHRSKQKIKTMTCFVVYLRLRKSFFELESLVFKVCNGLLEVVLGQVLLQNRNPPRTFACLLGPMRPALPKELPAPPKELPTPPN